MTSTMKACTVEITCLRSIDWRPLVRDLLKADAAYRRDAGAFGDGDTRTIRSGEHYRHAIDILRSVFVHHYGSYDLVSRKTQSTETI